MLGLIPTDLDLATDAPPQLVKEIVETTPELAFAKGPKNAHKFGSFKVGMFSWFSEESCLLLNFDGSDFLVACTRLYNPLCPSVGRSVRPSVGR